jgi:hypothetical protein
LTSTSTHRSHPPTGIILPPVSPTPPISSPHRYQACINNVGHEWAWNFHFLPPEFLDEHEHDLIELVRSPRNLPPRPGPAVWTVSLSPLRPVASVPSSNPLAAPLLHTLL